MPSRQHVRRVRQQGQRSGDEAGDDFAGHERRDQGERAGDRNMGKSHSLPGATAAQKITKQ
jgi:hypothetical protein